MIQKYLPLCCPCEEKADLFKISNGLLCSNENCAHNKSQHSFKEINGIPILISEINTDTVCSIDTEEIYINRPFSGYEITKKILFGESVVTKKNCKKFIKQVNSISKEGKILVVGGGEKGSGTSELWKSKNLEIVSFDIYASSSTDVVCDAHHMPFKENSFDGVWIQAVLEHVIEPSKVVSEIYRVLNKKGIVYAETPFMQQVHEGAYDFTRFTVLGHRYLFKDFEMIEIGGNKGPEFVLAWAVRYFFWALIRNKFLARIIGIGFGILMRPFAPLMSKKSMYDASSGVFFLGRKAEGIKSISHKDLIKLYKGQF